MSELISTYKNTILTIAFIFLLFICIVIYANSIDTWIKEWKILSTQKPSIFQRKISKDKEPDYFNFIVVYNIIILIIFVYIFIDYIFDIVVKFIKSI